MNRLLWKELREKRIWLLPLIAPAVGLVVLGKGFTFVGNLDAPSPWSSVSLLAALLMGAGAYSSEIAAGTADFAYSRPISWKKLILAKVIVGLGLIVLTAVLTAIVFRLACPAPYVRFLTPSNVAFDIGCMTLAMGAAYLLGFACSTVLPGVIGGVLVAVLIALSLVIDAVVTGVLHYDSGEFWSFCIRIVGAAMGTILLARFGLTLPTSRRLIRYSAVLGIAFAIGLPFDFVMNSDYVPLSGENSSAVWNVSPDGRFAALESRHVFPCKRSPRVGKYFLRLPGVSKAKTSWPDGAIAPGNSYWSSSGALVSLLEHSGHWTIWITRMDKRGRVHTGTIRIPSVGSITFDEASVVSSPDGRWALVATTDKSCDCTILTFVDIEHARVLPTPENYGVTDYWWQSDTEASYIGEDLNGEPEQFTVRFTDSKVSEQPYLSTPLKRARPKILKGPHYHTQVYVL